MSTYGTADYWQQMYQEERDRAQRESDAEFDRRKRERKQREQEREENRQYHRRTATDWFDALRKQAALFQEFHDEERLDAEKYGIDDLPPYFGDSAAACNRGWHILAEEMAGFTQDFEQIRVQIEALEQKHRDLRAQAVVAAAVRLESEAESRDGWLSVARALSGTPDTESALSAWLNW